MEPKTVVAVVFCVLFFASAFGSTWAMWRERESMMLRARSPVLALVQALALTMLGGVFFVQEIISMNGGRMPCWIPVYNIYLSSNPLILTIIFRDVRVLVMSDAKLRDSKFIKLLDWRVQAFAIANGVLGMAAIATGLVAAGLTVQPRYCLGHMPGVFWCSVLLSITPPYAFLIWKLYTIKDKIGMGKEIARALAAFYIFAGPYLVLVTLQSAGVMLPLDTRIHFLMVAMCWVILIDLNVVSRHAWGEVSSSKKKGFSERVRGSVRCAVDAVAEQVDVYAAKWQSSVDIMRCTALNAAFAAHVERCLCYESYRFLADAMAYTTESHSSVLEQHAAFEHMVATYIVAGSTFEINVNHKMRTKITANREQATFVALDPEVRRNMFKEAAAEVARMLDQNLIASFRSTSQFKTAVAEQKRIDASTSEA